MAEDFASKTEAPTPRRREQARDEGQVAYSNDLVTGLLLLAGAVGLVVTASSLGSGLLTAVRFDLLNLGQHQLGLDDACAALARCWNQGLGLCGLLLGLLFAVALGGGLVQVGVRLTPGVLALKWEKILPFAGEPRLLSWAKLIRGLAAVAKVIVLATAVYLVLRGQGPALARLTELRLDAAVGQAWGLVLRLTLVSAGVLFLLGAADYVLQRWRFERSLRMSRQELKDELKRDEGDPLIKARVRKLQREAARKQMFHEVKKATVVVTNPTHLAVALRYERGAGAPRVVAKGAGFVAQRIVELARRHGVPVLERKPLAQALFRTVQLNQEIPTALYYAVAELLAYVYKQRATAA
jgi:flagellar biosynthetic protein FlhB